MEYSKEQLEKIDTILDLMSYDRHSLRQACRATDIKASTFMRWVSNDSQLAERYAVARDALIETIADELLEIADNTHEGVTTRTTERGVEITKGDMYNHRRLQIDTRKFLLAKLAPYKYGEFLRKEEEVTDLPPIQIVVQKNDTD